MRTSFAFVSLFFCGWVVGAAGCGGDSGPSAATVCSRRAQVVCKKRQECSQGYVIKRDFGTLPSCETEERQVCLESVNRTGSGNTPSYSARCTDAMERQTCAARALGVELPDCDNAVGSFKNGAACISANQCNSSYCDIPPGQPCGKCAAKLADGMPCDATGDCNEGSYCQRPPMVLMGTCTKAQPEGGACNDLLRCDAGVSCVGFSRTQGTDGACRTPTVAAGQPCNAVDKLCLPTLRCVGVTPTTPDGVCQAPRTRMGDVCDRRNRMDVDCEANIGLYCHHDPDPATMMATATGTCMNRVIVAPAAMCGSQLPDGSTATCERAGTCQRPLDPVSGAPNTGMPGACVADVGEGVTCNTDGNIGPGCLGGTFTCVLKTPGASTEGICRKRTFEVLCPAAKK